MQSSLCVRVAGLDGTAHRGGAGAATAEGRRRPGRARQRAAKAPRQRPGGKGRGGGVGGPTSSGAQCLCVWARHAVQAADRPAGRRRQPSVPRVGCGRSRPLLRPARRCAVGWGEGAAAGGGGVGRTSHSVVWGSGEVRHPRAHRAAGRSPGSEESRAGAFVSGGGRVPPAIGGGVCAWKGGGGASGTAVFTTTTTTTTAPTLSEIDTRADGKRGGEDTPPRPAPLPACPRGPPNAPHPARAPATPHSRTCPVQPRRVRPPAAPRPRRPLPRNRSPRAVASLTTALVGEQLALQAGGEVVKV